MGKIEIKKASTNKNPELVKQDIMKKEAAISMALKTTTGLKKLAAALANPVRKYLDYVAIFRKVVVTEVIPDGMIAYFDNDIEEWSGVKVGMDGNSRFVVVKAIRTIVPEFEITSNVKIPYRELRVRKYKVFDRAKQRLQQSLQIKEDLTGFALLHDAAEITNTEITVAGILTKNALALAFREVEKHRLLGVSVIMNPDAVSAIRRWDWDQVDEVARIEIRQTGYLGNLWGANFFVTNLIEPDNSGNSFAYVTASPQFLGWMPMRADTEIIPADRPDDLLLGFTGYELLGMIIHNARAVARVKFNVSI